jgi:hypothetical protein
MIELLVIRWIKRVIARKVIRAMFKKFISKTKGKLTYAGIAALAFGYLEPLIGVNLLSSEVDALVTAGGVIAAIYGRYRATKAG